METKQKIETVKQTIALMQDYITLITIKPKSDITTAELNDTIKKIVDISFENISAISRTIPNEKN